MDERILSYISPKRAEAIANRILGPYYGNKPGPRPQDQAADILSPSQMIERRKKEIPFGNMQGVLLKRESPD